MVYDKKHKRNVLAAGRGRFSSPPVHLRDMLLFFLDFEVIEY
jgi:hypothetical protein